MVKNRKCQAHNIHKDMWFLKIIWEYTSTKVWALPWLVGVFPGPVNLLPSPSALLLLFLLSECEKCSWLSTTVNTIIDTDVFFFEEEMALYCELVLSLQEGGRGSGS